MKRTPNVLIGGSDTTQELRRLTETGGGYNQLQRDPTSLAGEAGEGIVSQQALQQGAQTGINAMQGTLQTYTNEKARRFRVDMLNTLQNAEQQSLGVQDPNQHFEIWNNAINSLKEQKDKIGILNRDDENYFSIFLNNKANDIAKDNFLLTQRKIGQDVEDIHNKVGSYLDSSKSTFQEHATIIQDSANEKIRALTENGMFDQTKAEQVANEGIEEHILIGANSKANPNIAEEYATRLYDKDENGEYTYFKSLQGQQRQKLADKVRYIAAKNTQGNMILNLSKGIDVGENNILSNPFLDNQTKAQLLTMRQRIIGDTIQQKYQNFKDNILSSNMAYAVDRRTAESFLNGNELEDIAKKNNYDANILRRELRESYLKSRKSYEDDPVGTLLSDKRLQGENRDNLFRMQKMFGTGDNDLQILSNKEKIAIGELIDNAQTPQEKMQMISFQHPLMKGFLAGIGIQDSEAQDEFIEKYKWNILSNVKNVNSEDKLAMQVMSKNPNDQESNLFASQLFSLSGRNKTTEDAIEDKTSQKFATLFADSDIGRYLTRNRDLKENNFEEVYKDYLKAGKSLSQSKYGFSESDVLKNIEKHLHIGIINNSNMDLHFNNKTFSEGYIKNSLKNLQLNYEKNQDYLLSQLGNADKTKSFLKEPNAIRKIKDHSKWTSDGDNGFKLEYEDQFGNKSIVGYVGISKDEKGKQSLDIPYDKDINIDIADYNF